jgi:hypothetical protein
VSRPDRSGVFSVARSKDGIYVRVVGLGNMNNSVTFKDFADRMLEEGYRVFVLDLAECRGIDSTFMGIMLGLREGLVVVNATAHCRRQMESIGLHRVIRIQDGPASCPSAVELRELPEAEADPIARLKLIMKAHQDLIAIDRRNEERFGAFLKDIARNLAGGERSP